jgi:predicted choloylglycine hydrolase
MNRFYRTTAVCVVTVAACLALCVGRHAPVGVVGDPHASASPAEQSFPIPIVQLHGSSADLGQQQGTQLADSIHLLHDKYLQPFVGPAYKRFIALTAANLFEDQLRPEHRDEIHALALSTHIDERETMLGQCFLDLAQLSACSTIALPASASPDGIARFGRNLDFPSLNIADKMTNVLIVHPDDGRYAFASIGWPGMVGVLSGMNQYGLCLANMEVPRHPRGPAAMPYTLLYRTVLERCKNVPQAIALLQQTPVQTANNLMLMDASGARAVVELSPDYIHVRRADDHTALISTNHQRNQDTQTPGLCKRYDYLHVKSQTDFGHINRAELEQLLAHVGNRTTLQTMIFEPANRVLYLSTGSNAASKPLSKLDLRSYFQFPIFQGAPQPARPVS